MKCLRKYPWLKVFRDNLPQGKGLMLYWSRLAAKAAFRDGKGLYCGHWNRVTAGMWSGGIVGLKSILGVKRRDQALQIMNALADLGYIEYSLDRRTKHLTYRIKDWVMNCCGAPCDDGTVYATEGYGFFCVPRNITERLAEKNIVFGEADAWLDLWCHTTYKDYGNAFSFLCPVIQFGKYESLLSLDFLGNRWGWERTKVWRFFQNHACHFGLFRMPGSYGSLIFNLSYFGDDRDSMPSEGKILFMLGKIREASRKGIRAHSDRNRVNCMIAWNSRKVMKELETCEESEVADHRVAPTCSNTRAYFSHGRNCKYSRNSINDCPGNRLGEQRTEKRQKKGKVNKRIRAGPVPLHKIIRKREIFMILLSKI